MNDTDKRKTLYDEIFSENKAPQVTDNNGVQEIKDAIDNKKFDDKDMVNLEDIFVFDSENKDSKTKTASSSLKSTDSDDDCLLEDAKYYDLINNTLVDLRLNLEEVKSKGTLGDINLDNLIKKDDDVKGKEISPSISFKSNSLNISYNSFKTGDTYEIIYKKINNPELLSLTSNGDVIYLSDYQNDDSIKSNFAKFIYNDTDKDITINTTSNASGLSTSNLRTIPAGAIYGYDWMLSNAKVKIN